MSRGSASDAPRDGIDPVDLDAPRLRQIPRLDAELGALDLFTRLDEGTGSLSDPARIAAVIDRLRDGVQRSLDIPSRVYGWHVQSMFAEIVLALGKARLLKEDDQGATWVEPAADVRPADYRIVLRDGQTLLVEVKNCGESNPLRWFGMPLRNLDGLQRYADLVGGRPVVAIFWAAPGIWTLVGLERFERTATRARIRLPEAMHGNEMAILGDRMVGTVPPLEFRIDFEEVGPRAASEDRESYQVTLKVTGVRLSAGGRPLTKKAERRLLFYLVMNGPWPEREHYEEDEGKARHVRFVFEPEEWSRQQGFALLGWYSELFTRAYWQRTSNDGEVSSLRARLDPQAEGFVIPPGYKSDALPLWRFRLEPTPIEDVLR